MDQWAIKDWRQDDVTKFLTKLLIEAREEAVKELMSFGTEVDKIQNKYFYLQGVVKGIDIMLEAELEESEE